MQPVPQVSPADVTRIVQREFPSARFDAVWKVLQAYGVAPGENAPDRVRLAALKLAAGEVAELERWIAAAKGDPRDVLAAAEYPRASQDWSRLELLPDEDRQRVFGADWDQYHRWLTHLRTAP